MFRISFFRTASPSRVAVLFGTARVFEQGTGTGTGCGMVFGLMGTRPLSDARKHFIWHQPVQARRPGQILDKYVPLDKAMMPSILSPRGWSLRWTNVKNTIVSTLRLKRKLGAWSAVSFAADAEKMYERMNQAFSSGDKVALADMVSENIYSELKNAINKREKEGHRVKWQWEQIDRPKVVNVRLASDEASKVDLAQVTVRLRHRQIAASFDKKGKLVAGDPHKAKELTEYIVVEKYLGTPRDWRICGKLVPPTLLEEDKDKIEKVSA